MVREKQCTWPFLPRVDSPIERLGVKELQYECYVWESGGDGGGMSEHTAPLA
jgi:hypothetical protein